jgi:hypothetical protein
MAVPGSGLPGCKAAFRVGRDLFLPRDRHTLVAGGP